MALIPRIYLQLLVASTVGAFQISHHGRTSFVAHQSTPALLTPQSSPRMRSSTMIFDKESSDEEAPQSDEKMSKEDSEGSEEKVGEEAVAVEAEVIIDEPKEKGLLPRIKLYFRGNKQDDGLTFRQRMAKMGLSVVLSYGWVSNMSYCISVSIAWYIFNQQVRHQHSEQKGMPQYCHWYLNLEFILSLYQILRRACLLWQRVNGSASWLCTGDSMCSTISFDRFDWPRPWLSRRISKSWSKWCNKSSA